MENGAHTSETLVAALPSIGGASLFLDFDGTLVDLAETPDGIAVPEDLGALLAGLGAAMGGALAVVSGRSVDDIRGFLPGYDGIISGGHGAELHLDGRTERHAIAGSDALRQITQEVQEFADVHPGLLAEPKPTGIVLHYRRAPDLAAKADAEIARLADAHPGLEMHRAKMAAELRPDDIGKAGAVAQMMKHAPFHGRAAAFFGDDATDEPAMRLAVERGGIAVKVGDGATCAPLRAPSPEVVRAALARWLETSG